MLREIILFLFFYGPIFFVGLPVAILFGLNALTGVFDPPFQGPWARGLAVFLTFASGYLTFWLDEYPPRQLQLGGGALAFLAISLLFPLPVLHIIAVAFLAGVLWVLSAITLLWFSFRIFDAGGQDPFPFSRAAWVKPEPAERFSEADWRAEIEADLIQLLTETPWLNVSEIVDKLAGDATIAKLRPFVDDLAVQGKISVKETEFGRRYGPLDQE